MLNNNYRSFLFALEKNFRRDDLWPWNEKPNRNFFPNTFEIEMILAKFYAFAKKVKVLAF